MSMVVQHNINAMNANRMLGMTTNLQAKSMERLSSGYRINRAADDAAGLSISEKMRKQIRGLTQASSNAQDGISAVQTAEGALNETQSMLQRMNELAVQAANDTNSDTDRKSIQDEIDQLSTEIDRVSDTTKFNEIYLLKGDSNGVKKTTYSYSTQASISNTDLYVLSTSGTYTTVKAGTILDNNTTYYSGTTAELVGSKIDFSVAPTVVGTKIDSVDLTGATYATSVTVFTAGVTADYYYKLEGSAYVAVSEGDRYDTTAVYYTMDTSGTGGITYSAISGAIPAGDLDAGYVAVTDFYDEDGKAFKAGSVIDTTKTYFSDVDKSLSKIAYAKQTTVINTDNLYVKTTDGYQKVAKGATYDSAATYYTMTAQAGGVSYAVASTATVATAIGYVAATTIYDKDGKTIAAGTSIDTAATYFSSVSKSIKGITVTDLNSVKTTAANFQFMDKDGNEIASNGLYRFFGEDGSYQGGLFTKDSTGARVEATESLVKAYTETGTSETGALKFSLQVGADATDNNQISVEIEAMGAKTLGIKGLSVTGDDNTKAKNAIETIDAAIKKVSSQRSSLGAIQNRLEHTIANLDNIVENTTSAESQIRDTDMAKEMVNYSKNNILTQAGQSMLAQANQSTQGILSLLK